MSDCGVCLYSDCDAPSEFCAVRVVKARKPHQCEECGCRIPVGEKYEYASGKFEGEFWTATTCLLCAEIADAFYCDGRTFGGGMWDQMREHVFEDLTTGCLEKLTTAAAKKFLLDKWREWKFE